MASPPNKHEEDRSYQPSIHCVFVSSHFMPYPDKEETKLTNDFIPFPPEKDFLADLKKLSQRGNNYRRRRPSRQKLLEVLKNRQEASARKHVCDSDEDERGVEERNDVEEGDVVQSDEEGDVVESVEEEDFAESVEEEDVENVEEGDIDSDEEGDVAESVEEDSDVPLKDCDLPLGTEKDDVLNSDRIWKWVSEAELFQKRCKAKPWSHERQNCSVLDRISSWSQELRLRIIKIFSKPISLDEYCDYQQDVLRKYFNVKSSRENQPPRTDLSKRIRKFFSRKIAPV